MAQSVLKNNNNVVLKQNAGGGFCIKQNYVIGKGFRNNGGYTTSITNKRGLNLQPNYTIEAYFNFPGAASGTMTSGNVFLLQDSTPNYLNFHTSDSPYYIMMRNINAVSGGSGIRVGSQSYVGNPPFYTAIKVYNDWQNTVNQVTNFFMNGQLYGSSTNPSYSSSLTPRGTGIDLKIPSDSASSLRSLVEFKIYSRILSDTEIVHNCNNKSINEPFSADKLELWLKFSNPNILDFSDNLDGSNMIVGFPDYSGYNRHLSVTGLPAGSNEYKLSILQQSIV